MSETPKSQTPRFVDIMEIVERKHEEITQSVERYVKAWINETLRVHVEKAEALTKLRMKLIKYAYTRDDEWREVTQVDLMGFDISEVSVREIFEVDRNYIILYIALPNGRVYRIVINLVNTRDMVKDVYTKYMEEYNKTLEELQKIAEEARKRKEEEEIRRKLEEYERLKEENEKLKEKIEELERELNELRDKCSEEESEEE